MYIVPPAVQNERDRISCRRPSYEEQTQGNGLSVMSLLNAEMLSRQVGAALEVICTFCHVHRCTKSLAYINLINTLRIYGIWLQNHIFNLLLELHYSNENFQKPR